MHHRNAFQTEWGFADLPLLEETGRNSSSFVMWVQRSLNQVLGLDLAVDGTMGRKTRSAVRVFQRRQGLKADGIVGSKTTAALRAALAGPAPRPPSTPTPVPPPATTPATASAFRRWYTTGGQPPMQPIRAGNEVIPLVGGRETFAAMVRAMRTVTSSEHYIYLLGWTMTDSFELVPGDRNSTIQALFARASARGAQVRVMLWDQFGTQNTAEVKRVNALRNGAGILDNRTVTLSRLSNFGSHHQKLLLVKGNQGLIAFCGGIDINPDRIRASGSGGSGSGSGGGGGGAPLHDVHCQIQGPAAHDLLRVVLERWHDHPAHLMLDMVAGKLQGRKEPIPQRQGSQVVQIGRTYGNGRSHRGVSGGYAFAPNGEQTISRMVFHAIRQARRFIYLEDQYLVHLGVSRALLNALPRIQHLTILIHHSSLFSRKECPQQFHRRRFAFLMPLVAAARDKVRVFQLHPPGAPNTYVHSKMWIFDDEFAIVGSANCNLRSYTHDSEVAAGIYDGDFARQLRIKLWAKHLNMDTPMGRAALADGVTSGRFWLAPPRGARIARYDHLASLNVSDAPRCRVASWDTHIDPDGS